MYAILVLCLLSFVAAQTPVPCTTPPQWEAHIFEVNEQNRFMVRARLTYDSINRRERALEQIDAGPQESNYEIIALFNNQIEYIYDFKARNCTRRPLTRQWRDFGIRPDARSLGEAYVGSSVSPSTGVLVTLWGGNHTGPSNDTVRTFGSWTYQACLPVRHISHSSQYGRTERSFFDITAGIHNPDVFIPRQECLTQEEYAMRDVLFGKTPKKIQQ